ncbi:MAG: uracil-DNA glycosylase family protein [Sphingobium sp.]
MIAPSPLPQTEPVPDCPLCPRMVAARAENRAAHPGWWNAPVLSLGDPEARIVIIGSAPARQGANRTGRMFVGDDGGERLYAALAACGLLRVIEDVETDDEALQDAPPVLRGVMLLSAVRCAPPQHSKPLPDEIRTCRTFLGQAVEAIPQARVFVALGQVAHQSAVKTLGGRLPKARFAQGAEHRMPDGRILIDSHVCSGSNLNAGLLTVDAFEAVLARAVELT